MSIYDKVLDDLWKRLTKSTADLLGLQNNETVNVDVDDGGFFCLRCGYFISADLPSPFAYCPKCGRKVVDEKELPLDRKREYSKEEWREMYFNNRKEDGDE